MGTTAAVLCAWFGVPLAVLFGAVGVVAGAVLGFFSGTPLGGPVTDRVWMLLDLVIPLPVAVPDLIPDIAWQLGAMLGLIIGAVYAGVTLAWLGLTGSWLVLFEADPTWPFSMMLGNVAAALVLGAAVTSVMVAAERWRLTRFGGAREASAREADMLAPAVAAAARTLGVASVPHVLIADAGPAGVLAHARHLVVSRALLAECAGDPDRLTARIGRELIHWRAGHPVTKLWVQAVALPLTVVYEVAARLLAPSTNTRARPATLVLYLLLWPFVVTVRHIMVPIQAAWWRRATVEADAIAAECGWGAVLADVLAAAPAPEGAGVVTWRTAFDTTPPAETRIDALERAGVPRRDLAADLAEDQPRNGRHGLPMTELPQLRRQEVPADAD
ncbi:M48 family metalloprotease [Glycomyces artemisiae]|uniref:Zn-dependent protease with chaperone function n=1 Tax=Glycomyces artemisiae TaxID=1076443 RepID=A0A2T0UI20_9ACTN|nr:M48 family metalloprotease [Glycomyces artemisiae]PRY57593.1 Zn-dependent protease with chaperone function [Glycomyces artemisiae]